MEVNGYVGLFHSHGIKNLADTYKKSCYARRRTIKPAKHQYRIKIESYYSGSITDYKGKPSHKMPNDTSLPDELNAFYDHFEASNTEPCVRAQLFQMTV
jgi:hypothetical protein